MSIRFEIVNFDQEYQRLTNKPVLVNDFDLSNPEEEERLKRYLYTQYDNSDTIDISASCDCGATTGMYNHGMTCGICDTIVENTSDRTIHSQLWIKAPEGIKGLIIPQLWIMLSKYIGQKDYHILMWLTDPNYNPSISRVTTKSVVSKVRKLSELNIPRGLNNFIDHFDEIMQLLLDHKIIEVSRQRREELELFFLEYKHCFFPQYIPIPSKLFFIVEKTTSGIYIDKPLAPAIDAVLTIANTNSELMNISKSRLEHYVVRSISMLATFYDEYTKERLLSKEGLFRKHVYGSRLNFTARGVITSISDPHNAEELHLPWGMAVQLFKYHIISKLLRRGFPPNVAIAHVYSHVMRHDPLIDEIFQELIAEAPNLGPACSFQRN